MCAHSIVHVLVSQQWTVLNNPQPSGAFYSPWFGMDPADNLNLIQVSTHQQATHTHTLQCPVTSYTCHLYAACEPMGGLWLVCLHRVSAYWLACGNLWTQDLTHMHPNPRYFQWSPISNSNSNSIGANTGSLLAPHVAHATIAATMQLTPSFLPPPPPPPLCARRRAARHPAVQRERRLIHPDPDQHQLWPEQHTGRGLPERQEVHHPLRCL